MIQPRTVNGLALISGDSSPVDVDGCIAFVMASGIDEVLTKVRRASRADNELLVDLMAHVPMEGSLALSTRRDPDFFALYDIQRGSAHAFTYDDGKMQGMASALVRDGFLDGATQRVGYL